MAPVNPYFGRVRELFDQALIVPPPDRAAYLDTVCAGDPSLRADLVALLGAHADAGSFLESPIVESAVTWDRTPGAAAPPVAPLWEGRVLAHYRLEERLAAGGMGVVYRAVDIALGRPAAVKILPHAASPALSERLKAEGAACARLQHPAIATYFESGEVDGTVFVAMEFVRGRTLRAKLRDGALPASEALAVIDCVLEALNHAHAAGVLHRDIKPENIIATGARTAKLLDFGIARLLVDSSPDATTAFSPTGASLVGTVGYMSPEQIRNESLDARSDVFQAAAVLYELLAGRPAFPGRTSAERLAAVLTTSPPALTGIPDAGALTRVLARALARDRAERTPSAAVLLSDLRAIGGHDAAAGLPQTIAVPDFRNLAATPDDDWIGTGLAESLSADLSKAVSLVVMPRPRVLLAAGAAFPDLASERTDAPDKDAVALGSVLGCRWVLAGAYRRLGPALRVDTTLLEVATGHVAGRDQFDGTVAEIFQLQDRIITALRAHVDTGALGATVPRPVVSAYECYARGRRLLEGFGRDGLRQACDWFERAVEIDPAYAPALAGLAQIHGLSFTFTTDPAALEAALRCADRALAADPSLSDAEIWRGYALLRLKRYDESAAALERARQLSPSSMLGYYFATGPMWTRDPDRAIGLQQRAIQLAPGAGYAWATLGSIFFGLERYAEALSCFARGGAVSGPGATPVPGIEGYAAECHRAVGGFDEARRLSLAGLDGVERSDNIYRDTGRVTCLFALGRAAFGQGDRRAAQAALRQAVAHVRGRARMTAGGILLVRALATLALLDDETAFAEACQLADNPDEFDFSWYWLCDEFLMYRDLAEAAHRLGRTDVAPLFVDRARATAPVLTPVLNNVRPPAPG